MSIRNDDVARVNFRDNAAQNTAEVQVNYKQQARFLGFIPVNLPIKVTVQSDANGNAEAQSRLAWWSFLASDVNYDKQEVESRIENNASIMVKARADADAQTKSELAEEIAAEMRAYAQGQARGNINAAADASANMQSNTNVESNTSGNVQSEAQGSATGQGELDY